ncbi:hypothetical protein Ocin01_11287 [Orchesella cincta]|uniref:Uncharacterized protein n=1 Tax=Orchesella cincta TaxID=48709 RepID=A0A1D2MQR2_ORCCI|nr:hypothetical protein Ocin01_11287 [Orchesella cincta]
MNSFRFLWNPYIIEENSSVYKIIKTLCCKALKAAADAEAAFLAANGGRRRKGRKGANEDDTDGDGSLGRTLDGEADGSSGRTLDGEGDGSSGETLDGEADGSSGRTLDGGEPSSEELEGVDYDEPSGMMMGRSLHGIGSPMGRALSVPAEDAEQGVAGRVMDGDDVATEDLQNDKNKKSPGAAGNPKDPGTLELLYGKSADGEPSLLTVVPPAVNTTEIDAAGMERLSEVNKASTQKDAKNAIALAMGVSQNVTANAVSKTGDDAVALAISSALSKGTGTAKSDALALESNATSGAVAGSGGAVSNAITHKTGHALSQASTSEGGSGKASSVATGVGGSRAGAHSVGGGNSTAVAKSVDGNAESDTVSKDGGASYSASWAKNQGSSFSNAVTYGAAGTRAESLSDGVGTAVAKAYQINTLEDTDSDRHLDMDEVVDGFGVHNGDEFMNDPFFRGRTPGGLSLKDLAGHGDDEIAEFLPGYGRVVEDGSWLAGYTEDGSDVKARKKREADEDDYETAPPDDLKLGEKREADEDDYDTSPPNPSNLKLGRGNASSHAVAQGQEGGSETEAIAVGGFAHADSTSVRGTNALSSAQTLKTGDASSKSIALMGGNSSAASVAKGQGNARSNSWADDRGHSKSLSKAKEDFMLKKEIKDFGSSEEVNVEEEDSEEPDTVSDAARKKRHGGYALSKSTSRGFGESYSAASTIKDGNAASYSVSQLDASRADADAEEGSALANAVVDPHINQDPLLSSDGSEAPRGRLLEHEMEDDIATLFCGIC